MSGWDLKGLLSCVAMDLVSHFCRPVLNVFLGRLADIHQLAAGRQS